MLFQDDNMLTMAPSSSSMVDKDEADASAECQFFGNPDGTYTRGHSLFEVPPDVRNTRQDFCNVGDGAEAFGFRLALSPGNQDLGRFD